MALSSSLDVFRPPFPLLIIALIQHNTRKQIYDCHPRTNHWSKIITALCMTLLTLIVRDTHSI